MQDPWRSALGQRLHEVMSVHERWPQPHCPPPSRHTTPADALVGQRQRLVQQHKAQDGAVVTR